MARRIPAMLAVTAVVIHCVLGCCAKHVHACFMPPSVSCAEHDTHCGAHQSDEDADHGAQRASAYSSSEACKLDDSGTHRCPEGESAPCGENKCPFILTNAPVSSLFFDFLSSSSVDNWIGLSSVKEDCRHALRRSLATTVPIRHGDALRRHLCLGILLL